MNEWHALKEHPIICYLITPVTPAQH